MFRRTGDFLASWAHESGSTLRLLRSLNDASLRQPIVPGGRTLGFLAWHLTVALPVMTAQFGLAVEGPGHDAPVPDRAAEIADAYERSAGAVRDAVAAWADGTLERVVDFYGRPLPIGLGLEMLIRHQAHHRGQMTVLMRQAGVPVPGMYGPSREEWSALGVPAQA